MYRQITHFVVVRSLGKVVLLQLNFVVVGLGGAYVGDSRKYTRDNPRTMK